MSGARHIFAALVLVCLLASCGGRPKIIPRGVLSDIYAEMFLADQWMVDHNSERKRADTMLFYDPIFRRYGYTFEDYDASVKHYLKDPEKFSRLFRDASAKLRKDEKKYRDELDRLERVREFNASIKGYSPKSFEEDTLLWRTAYKDSLRRLAFVRDSLLRDSVFRDSLRRDSLVRDSLRLDSLHLARERKDKPVPRLPRKAPQLLIEDKTITDQTSLL